MKIPDYSVDDSELRNFVDKMRSVWNFGKYQDPIVTSLPNWSASDGESVLYRPSTGGTTKYYFLGTAWVSTWSFAI